MSENLEVTPVADPVAAPTEWGKAVSAAYLRLLGGSQELSAKGAGISRRTIQLWESCSWWADACAEADARWLHDLTAASRSQLLEGIRAGDTGHALKVLERVHPALAPKGGPTIVIPQSFTINVGRGHDGD